MCPPCSLGTIHPMRGRSILRNCLIILAGVIVVLVLIFAITWPRVIRPLWSAQFHLSDLAWPTKFRRLQPYGTDKLLDLGYWDQTVLYDLKGNVLWSAASEIGDDNDAGTAVAANGSLYVVTKQDRLYAFDPLQHRRWTFPVNGIEAGRCRPAVGADGTVYVTAPEDQLYALSADGELFWREEINGLAARRLLSVGPDGTIYAQTYDHQLLAIAPDGREKWRSAPQAKWGGQPLFSQGHIIVVYRKLGLVIAYNTDGTVAWTYTSTMEFDIADAEIGPDGTIYVNAVAELQPGATSENSNESPAVPFIPQLLALDPAGQLKWSVPFNRFFFDGTYAVLPDNRVCIVDLGPGNILQAFRLMLSLVSKRHGVSRLSVIDTSGKIKHLGWVPMTMPVVPPVALPDGKLLLLGEDNVMHCYQP
jgi:outer membrane protein assembly factor BamB